MKGTARGIPWKGNESKQGRTPRLVEQEYEQDSGKERGHEQEQGPEHELDQEHDKGDDEKEKVKKREKVKEKENEGGPRCCTGGWRVRALSYVWKMNAWQEK